jgi:hypothetical protein
MEHRRRLAAVGLVAEHAGHRQPLPAEPLPQHRGLESVSGATLMRIRLVVVGVLGDVSVLALAERSPYRAVGYFHTHLATIDGDWGTTICGNCYADLAPGSTVTVAFYSARLTASRQLSIVIRQRTRTDHRYPTPGTHAVAAELGTPPCSPKTLAASPPATSPRSAATAPNQSWPPSSTVTGDPMPPQLSWVTNAYPT